MAANRLVWQERRAVLNSKKYPGHERSKTFQWLMLKHLMRPVIDCYTQAFFLPKLCYYTKPHRSGQKKPNAGMGGGTPRPGALAQDVPTTSKNRPQMYIEEPA